MDKNEEYQIRNMIKDTIIKDTRARIDASFSIVKNKYRHLIVYPLVVLEQKYKEMSMQSLELGFDAMELFITLNPLRGATYWYIHEILKRVDIVQPLREYFDFSQEPFGVEYCREVLSLHQTFLRGNQIGLNRSVSRVEFNEVEKNKFELLFPSISEEYNKELLYYYGLDDALENEKEQKTVAEVDKYLFSIFHPDKLVKFPNRLFDYLQRIDNMKKNVDMKLYRLCKNRVSIDVNKIANELHSKIISDNRELKTILALFYYLSRLCMHQFTLETIAPQYISEKRMNYCYYKIKELYCLSKQVGIQESTMQRYIDYFSIDANIEKGGFAEFPLVVFENEVLWIPSSFILNDFQFSIVNGHYYKDINFPKHEETIAQSIVNYLVDSVGVYENIICGHNFLYAVPGMKFNGKDLQSDIDVALYDKESNVLLIIECKWKDNVYTYIDDYLRIERAVNEVYKTQLNKHKYYLEQEPGRYNMIFDNQVNIEQDLDSMKILYLFVDKRVQFHDKKEGRHVVSTFMMAYLFKKFSNANILDLQGIYNEIKNQNSKVKYERVALKKSVTLDGKIFI